MITYDLIIIFSVKAELVSCTQKVLYSICKIEDKVWMGVVEIGGYRNK